MSMVQRRVVFFSCLIVFIAAAVWRLRLEDDARTSAHQAQAQEGRIIDCRSHGEIVAFALDNPRGHFEIEQTARSPNETAPAQSPWRLLAPQKLVAETLIAQAITEATCDLRRQSWVHRPDAKEAPDYKIFNLSEPPYKLTLQFSDGETIALAAGDKTNFNNGLYVTQSTDPRGVALVDGAYLFQLDKDLFALRDKRLVFGAAPDIQEVQVTSNRPDITAFKLQREAQGFVLTTMGSHHEGPQQMPADAQAADSLMAALANMRAKSFVAEAPSPTDLAHFGLSRPFMIAELRVQDKPTVVRLGQVTLSGEKHYFAQVGTPSAPVAELPSDYVVEKLMHGARNLRDMQVFHLDQQAIQSFSWSRGDKHLAFVRRPSSADDVERAKSMGRPIQPNDVLWYLKDHQTPGPLEQADVHGLLFRLTNMRAESQLTRKADATALEAAGLHAPVWHLAFMDENEAVLASLSAGRQEGQLRLVTDQDHLIISRIFAAVVDDIDITGEAFRAEPVAETQPPKAL